MSVNFKDLETKLYDDLDIVLHTKSTIVINKIGTNKVFQDLLQKELNILFFISKKNKTDLTNANKLVAKFNELSKLDFKIDESYQPTDDDQIVDDINYLTIYVKNIFKVELKDLAKLDVKVAEQQVQQEDAPKPNNANPYAAYMGAMASAMGGANNPYADALMQGPAMMRVQSEIRSGKVFAYKNKSKVILWAKRVLSFLMILFTVAALLTGIFVCMCNNLKDGSTSESGTGGTQPTIAWGISFFLLAIFSGFYSYKSCLECFSKKNRNDNLIYHFTFSFSLIIIIVYAILFILDLFLIKYYGHTSFFDSFKYFLQANGDLKAPLYGWLVSLIITMTSFVLIVINLIVIKIYNPKPDTERMQALVQQYVEEMKKGVPPPANNQ